MYVAPGSHRRESVDSKTAAAISDGGWAPSSYGPTSSRHAGMGPAGAGHLPCREIAVRHVSRGPDGSRGPLIYEKGLDNSLGTLPKNI